MASEKSLFRKIYIVLSVAKSVKSLTLKDLFEAVYHIQMPPFLTKRYNVETDSMEEAISEKSIWRVLKLSIILGLITEDGRLTDPGRQSLQRNQFESVTAKRIHRIFRSFGISVSRINSVIRDDFQCEPPILPTCRTIWTQIDTEIPYEMFSKLLILLGHCGDADVNQTKIYLKVK